MERGSVSWGHGVTRPALLRAMRRKLQSIYLEMYMRKVHVHNMLRNYWQFGEHTLNVIRCHILHEAGLNFFQTTVLHLPLLFTLLP